MGSTTRPSRGRRAPRRRSATRFSSTICAVEVEKNSREAHARLHERVRAEADEQVRRDREHEPGERASARHHEQPRPDEREEEAGDRELGDVGCAVPVADEHTARDAPDDEPAPGDERDRGEVRERRHRERERAPRRADRGAAQPRAAPGEVGGDAADRPAEDRRRRTGARVLALLEEVGGELGPAFGRHIVGQVGGVPLAPAEYRCVHAPCRAVSNASGCLELDPLARLERDGTQANADLGLGASTVRSSVSARWATTPAPVTR